MTSIPPDVSVHALLNHTLTCFLLSLSLSLSLSLFTISPLLSSTQVQCYFLFFLVSEYKQYYQNEKKFKARLEQRAEAKSFACSCCRYEDGRWCCEGDTERGTDWVSRNQRSSWLVTQMIFNLIPVVLAVVVMDLLGKCKLNGEGGCPVELEGIQQKVSDSIAGQVFIFFKVQCNSPYTYTTIITVSDHT